MPLQQLDPITLEPMAQPTTTLRQLDPDTLKPIGDNKLQKILAAPGPSQEFTPGFMDPSGHRYGSSEEQFQKETAGKNIFSMPSEYLQQKTTEALTPKIGEEPARLAGAAVGGAAFPVPGMGTAARVGYGLLGQGAADMASRYTENPLIRFAAGIGIPLIASHGLERAYAMEGFNRAQGMEPAIGPEATAAAKDEAGIPAEEEPVAAAPSGPVEEGTAETKPTEAAPESKPPEAPPPIDKATGDVLNAKTENPKGQIFYLKAKDLRENPDLLKVDPETYQFKQNVNAKGVTKQLETIKKWDNGAQGTSTVHHTPEGDFIAEGHHRLDAFKRLAKDDDVLRFQVLNGTNEDIPGALEFDDPVTGEKRQTNVTPVEARTYAGLVNMKDQHGTALDMAKLLRDTGIKASDMEGLGISMSEAKTSDAAGMRELSPFLWKQLNTGQLPESWGVVLGREMPDDPAGQDEVYKQLAGKKYTTTQLADTIRLQRGSDVVSGGGGQGSFGGEGFDIKKTTLPQQVKILGEVRDTLTDTAKGMTGAAKGKAMLEAAGETKIDAPEMQKRAREARQVADLMPRFVYQSGSETNNVLKQLAYDLAEKPNEKNSIYEQARAKLPEAVKTDASRAGIEIGQAEPETPQGGLFGGEPGTTLSGGIVPLQAVEKAQSLARAVSTKLEASRPVTWLKQVFAPETMGPFAERASAIQEEQAAELRARVGSARLALEPFKDYMKGVEPAQRWNIYSQLEQGNLDVLPPEIRPAIQAAREALEKSWEEISKLRNGEMGYIENYLPHLYADDPEKVQRVFSELQQATGKSLQGSTGFTKQRYYTLISDAIGKGLTPRYENPADMILAGLQNPWRYITGQKIFRGLQDAGLTRFLKEGEQMPKGYAPIDDRIAQVRQYAPEYKGHIPRGAYVAPEQAARIINNYTGPGLRGGLFRSIGAMGNALRVELSTFHMLLEANSAADLEAGAAMTEGLGKLAHGDFVGGTTALMRVPKTWVTPVEGYKAWRSGRELQAAGKAGLFDDPAVKDTIMAGGSFDFGDSILTQSLVDAFGDKMGVVGKATQKALGFTMRQVVAPMKLGAFRSTYSRLLEEAVEKNGGEELSYVQRRGIAQQARRHIDNVMGQIARDNIHTTNSLKDWMGNIIAYPGWNIGTVRLFGGIGRGIGQIASGNKLDMQARLALQFAAGKILRVSVGGAILNKLITGDWPKNVYETWTTPTGQKDTKGNWVRVEQPEYMLRDFLSLMGRKKKEDPNDVMGWPHAIEGWAASKTNWPLQAGYEIITNADYFGRPIYFKHAESMPVQVGKIVKHIADTGGVPFTIKNIQEQQQQVGGTGGSLGQAAKQIAVGTLGLTPAPRTLRQTPMQNYVDQLEDQQIRIQPQSPQALQRQQTMMQLRQQMRQVRSGQSKGMPDMKAALAKGLTPGDIANEWKQSKLPPLEAALHRIPLVEVAKAYKIAESHEDEGDMKAARKVLIQRITNDGWKNLRPEDKVTLAPMLREILAPKKEERAAAGAI